MPTWRDIWRDLFPPDASNFETVLKVIMSPVIVPIVLAQLLVEQVLELVKVLSRLCRLGILTVLDSLGTVIARSVRLLMIALHTLHAHLLNPLVSAAHAYLVVPIRWVLYRSWLIIERLIEQLSQFAVKSLLRMCVWLFRLTVHLIDLINVLIEQAGRGLRGLGRLLDRALVGFARQLLHLASRFDHALAALGVYRTVELARVAVSHVLRSLFSALRRAFIVMTQLVSRAAHALHTTIVQPTASMLAAAGRTIAEALRSIWRVVYKALAAASRAVGQGLTATMRIAASALRATGRAMHTVGNATKRGAVVAWLSFLEWWRQPSWLSEVLFKPMIRQLLTAAKTLLRGARWLIDHALVLPARYLHTVAQVCAGFAAGGAAAVWRATISPALRTIAGVAAAGRRAAIALALTIMDFVRASSRAVASTSAAVATPLLRGARGLGAEARAQARATGRVARELARALVRAARGVGRALAMAIRGQSK